MKIDTSSATPVVTLDTAEVRSALSAWLKLHGVDASAVTLIAPALQPVVVQQPVVRWIPLRNAVVAGRSATLWQLDGSEQYAFTATLDNGKSSVCPADDAHRSMDVKYALDNVRRELRRAGKA